MHAVAPHVFNFATNVHLKKFCKHLNDLPAGTEILQYIVVPAVRRLVPSLLM